MSETKPTENGEEANTGVEETKVEELASKKVSKKKSKEVIEESEERQSTEEESEDSEEEVGRKKKKKNKKKNKKKKSGAEASEFDVISSEDEEGNEKPFKVKIEEIKDEKTGEVIDRICQVKLLDPELSVILRNAGLNKEKLFDLQPELPASELITYLPQLKQVFENYLNQYNHHIAQQCISPLIKLLEKEYGWLTSRIEKMVQHGEISFNHLWFIFQKGAKFFTVYEDEIVGSEVQQTKYQKTLFGTQFVITGEIIQTDGRKFFSMKKSFYVNSFEGTVKIGSLNVKPMNDKVMEELKERGKLFEKYGIGSHYLYYTGSIFRKSWFYTTRYKATGRFMVDCVSFTRLNPNYSQQDFQAQDAYDDYGMPIESGDTHITEEQYFKSWPYLRGFSFTSKKWGECSVSSLKPINFDSNAFDRLVLPNERKLFVKSIVEHSDKTFTDIISGKGGGCIILLHGAPGSGKTLTAESIAEYLRRPLYSISVGELGVNVAELEERLREILEVSSSWNAVCLIDEADVFLERRTDKDLTRNAMVGVFLRLLEYHQGILFLTTNRVNCFDEAFQSRISMAIRYDDLGERAREEVWCNFFELASIPKEKMDAKKLAQYELNGRQIKNILRLSQALAFSENKPIEMEHFERTIAISKQFDQKFSLVQ